MGFMHCALQSMGQYWPEENEECECGPFIIEAMSVDRQVPDITVRELKLSYQPTVRLSCHWSLLKLML